MTDNSERPAAGSSLARLEAIAVEAKLIRSSIRADLPDGYVLLSFVSHGQAERIQVSAGCAFHYGPGYAGPIPAVPVNPDRSTSLMRQSTSESYSWSEKSIGDALRSLVSDWKQATPDFDSIKSETKKSPVKGTELGQLLLAVWMEAFGQEAPSLEGLQKSVKRARSKKKDLRQQCLEWLKSGPAGVGKWNELRDDDRTGIGKLGQCQFANCDLREVLFHNQDLRGSDFQQANLQAARMGGADCRDATFRGADLSGAFLSGGKFVQTDFTDACCCNTAMRSADCRSAIFSGTDLSGADLGFGDIRQADLSTANLDGTDFFRAKYDEQTRFPADFAIKSEWMMEWKGAVPRATGYTKHCSLDELVALIPAPATPCDTTGNWDEAATAIGTRFPADFQSLIGTYGSGTILGDVDIYNPLIAADRKRIASDLDTLKQMREACEYLWQIHPEESGILPWGTDSNGNIFCWLTVGAPDEWPTALLGHGEDEPSSDAVNMTTFLYNFAKNIYPEMQGGQTFSASNYKFEPRRERPEYAHPAAQESSPERVEAKPAYSWDHLELTDPPAETPTPAEIARCETEFGFRLPDSYADFVSRFSGGTLGDNFRIRAPNEMYPNLITYRELLNFAPFRDMHAKRLPQLERLVPFCDTFYGDHYYWDLGETNATTGEYAVYYVQRDKRQPKRIALSFAEFVQFVTEGRVRMPGMTTAKARRVNWKTFRPFIVAPPEPEYTKHCSLEELLAVIPAPENPCDAEGDWDEAAAWNGARYPSDFQLLIAKYGSGTILGDVQFFNPLNAEDRKSVAALLDTLRQSRGNVEHDWQVHPEEYGILPWGADSKGNIFCWLTDDDPDEWASAILSPGDVEPTGDHINITTFLYNISQNLYGELPGGLVFSKSDHKFEPRKQRSKKQGAKKKSSRAPSIEAPPSVTKVGEAWRRIEDWCRQNHPRLLAELNGGATSQQVAAVESKIQRPLPDDVRESLLRHNGQPDGTAFPFLFGQLNLSSCDQIAISHERWKGWKGPDAGDPPAHYTYFPEEAIAYRYHDDGWIPIAEEYGNGNYLAVDLAPGPRGFFGQIIDFGADIFNKGVLAISWGDFLLSYAKLLESGRLGEIDTTPGTWSYPFESLFEVNALDALVGWVKVGRWPLM